MIDTHAHLDACDDPRAVVSRAREAGVTRIVSIGTTIDSCRATLAIADQEEGVFAALGIHPHEAAGAEAFRVDEVRGLQAHRKAVALGEIGLDFYRDYAPRDQQLTLFEVQLALATAIGKPVVIHSRGAARETARLLAGFDGTVVLHCFSELDLVPAALERRYYVSFAGNVTYPKAEDLREVARQVPGDRILAETDTPFLSPQSVRGRLNEPANVVHVVAALAAARGEDRDELAAQIDANATAAFSLP